jgi:cephalosporin hydroxylase
MIEEKYKQLCETPSDINEHLSTIRKYARLCDTIIEMGVRGMVSTWALLAGHPLQMASIDIIHPSEHQGDVVETKKIANEGGVLWDFVKVSSLDFKFRRTELLFIDTIHTYEQLIQELNLHAPHTTKYIIMHDTNFPEMQKAINEFLTNNNDWKTKEALTIMTGLTVLQRI